MDANELLERYAAGERDFKGVKLVEVNLSGVDLSRADFKGVSLFRVNLSGANLSRANLKGVRLTQVSLSKADLSRTDFWAAFLDKVNLRYANLTEADLSEACLLSTDLRYANLTEADLSEARLCGSDFSNANLSKANLFKASIPQANLSNAILVEANLGEIDYTFEANLSGANLSKAYLHKTNLRKVNLSGAKLKGALFDKSTVFPKGFKPIKAGAVLLNPFAPYPIISRKIDLRRSDLQQVSLDYHNLTSRDLSEANLTKAKLSNSNLSNSNLTKANLTEAKLEKANLCWVNLQNANLSRATLKGSNLQSADLSGANLSRVDLRGTNLSHANLTEADLSWADLRRANLSNANLQNACFDRMTVFPENFDPLQVGAYLIVSGTSNEAIEHTVSESTTFMSNLETQESIESRLTGENDSSFAIREIKDATEIFSLKNLEDARKRTTASVVLRSGQFGFRQRLFKAYNGRCAITRCNVEQALEAAHIYPYSGSQSDHVSNGLLLRADIHKLFDCYLLVIDPVTKEVCIAPDLYDSYRELAGRKLYIPDNPDSKPSQEALEWRFRQCQWINDSTSISS